MPMLKAISCPCMSWAGGVPENDIKAYAWISMAASQRDEMASKNKGLVTEKMTRQQIAEAQAYAARCFENDYKGCD
jgi:glutamate mutase epsilon subunit